MKPIKIIHNFICYHTQVRRLSYIGSTIYKSRILAFQHSFRQTTLVIPISLAWTQFEQIIWVAYCCIGIITGHLSWSRNFNEENIMVVGISFFFWHPTQHLVVVFIAWSRYIKWNNVTQWGSMYRCIPQATHSITAHQLLMGSGSGIVRIDLKKRHGNNNFNRT